jgi:hypothetical protein
MTDQELLKKLEDNGIEWPSIFLSPNYAEAICGYTEEGNIVYRYEDMIMSLAAEEAEAMKKEGENEIDMSDVELMATEWIDYNAIRSIPYMGAPRPIIINRFYGYYDGEAAASLTEDEIEEMLQECGCEESGRFGIEFSAALCGYTEEGAIAYKVDIIKEILTEKGINEKDAEEWIDRNIWMKKKDTEKTAPVFIYGLK